MRLNSRLPRLTFCVCDIESGSVAEGLFWTRTRALYVSQLKLSPLVSQ